LLLSCASGEQMRKAFVIVHLSHSFIRNCHLDDRQNPTDVTQPAEPLGDQRHRESRRLG
jgi:hypothetical protein